LIALFAWIRLYVDFAGMSGFRTTYDQEVQAMSKRKTFPLGRDAKSGRFIPVATAKRRPNTTTVERIPVAGRGDTAPKKRR
jgi:hypothetical protein